MTALQPAGIGTRLLVVDDDKPLQGLFTLLMKRAGFDVDCACDGEQAMAMLQERDYAAVILDLMMPGKSGFDVLERLERENPSLLTRIIVASGASRVALERVDASLVHAVVRKPFDIDHLVSMAVDCARKSTC